MPAEDDLRVLVVDDDPDTRNNLRDILKMDNFQVETADSVAAVLQLRSWDCFSAILLDRRLPDGDAEVLLPRLRQLAPEAAILIVTGYADLEDAISALRQGAADYILKPINADALRLSLARISERRRLKERTLQAERLAAIGQMVTGLAHESGNALARSQACLEMLAMEVEDRPEADEPDMRDYYRKILPHLGHAVAAAAATVDELIADCRTHHPDLVITDIKMPGLVGIDAAMKIYDKMPIPVILVSAYSDEHLIERAEADHIMAYLVKPIKQENLEPAISLAMRRFEQFEELRREASDMRQALEDRKIIERAKGVLMKELGLTEAEAFCRLQKTASAKNLKLIELAHTVLSMQTAARRV